MLGGRVHESLGPCFIGQCDWENQAFLGEKGSARENEVVIGDYDKCCSSRLIDIVIARLYIEFPLLVVC